MIDGFGRFDEGDYRRAFLLFDHVEYLLPSQVRGPLWYPQSVLKSREYTAHHLSIDLSDVEVRAMVERDLGDPGFTSIVARVPEMDRQYAANVIQTDPELAWLLAAFPDAGEAAALSALVSKLLLNAARTGAMPIVGQDHAWELIANRLKLVEEPATPTAGALTSLAEPLTFSLLHAGLALSFVDSDKLAELPFDVLLSFKSRNQRLLDQHQLHLLSVAQRLPELPDDGAVRKHIAALRLEARKEQVKLEQEAKDAWLSAGLDLGRKAAVAAASSAAPLVALLRHASPTELLLAALPGVGIAVAAGLSSIEKTRRARRSPFAYLFQAQKLADASRT